MIITHQPIQRRDVKNNRQIDRYCFRTHYDMTPPISTTEVWSTDYENCYYSQMYVIFTNKHNAHRGVARILPINDIRLTTVKISWEILDSIQFAGTVRMPCELMDSYDVEVLTGEWED